MPELLKTLSDKNGNAFFTLLFEPEAGLIYAEWKGKISLEEVRIASLTYLEALEQVPCSKLITDNTALETSWQALNDWVEAFWTPKAVALQLRHMALVVSPHFFVKLAAQDLSRRINNQLQIEIFNDLASARKWMAEI